ncbi:hypothetical protein PF008_g14112 [Phytophthora fragariae]|uniref:Uncharacterized protein n=1 Tax=Phytophthora fragariae TaxID=53985 RepID=A0A6G0RHX6_9STRA|nr:hypothetical protein PF008_g14112 [Phytophthora fragariae]
MLIPTALSAWNSFSTRTPFWSITPTYYEPELSKKRTAISSKVAQSVPKLPLELVQVVLRFQWQRRDRLLHLHLQVSKAHIQLLVLMEHVLLYAPMDRPRLHVLSAHPRLRVLNSRLQSRVIDDHLRVGELSSTTRQSRLLDPEIDSNIDACEEDDGEGNPLSTELLADNDDDLNAVGDGEDADEYGAIDSGDDAEKDDL